MSEHREFWLRGKPIEDLSGEEIDSLTWEEISTLFIAEETTCPNCEYEYSDEDIARWRAVVAADVPWPCPKCGQYEEPQVRHVHHMQELVTAWVDMAENFEWLSNLKPELRPMLEAQIAKARADLQERLPEPMLRWLDVAVASVPKDPHDEEEA